MTNFDKCILVVFGIIVPTGDNYSDIVTSYSFFTGTYTPAGTVYEADGLFDAFAQPDYYYYVEYDYLERGYNTSLMKIVSTEQTIYGLMTLLPILISFTMTLLHWYRTERTTKRLLLTLPLLLAQIWPQYRAWRILWHYMKGNRKWIKEKEHMDMQLASLGNFFHFYRYSILK